ncbi:MAG: hypothetical protein M3Y82_05115 [Verrucomicrobiota bacterium]|nr:hypothetical protein [Verrucomicrobiota bacterium]
MKNSENLSGKISDHFQGVGTITREMVTQRARELAVINGRDHFNDIDWSQAKQELLGGTEADATDEGVEMLTRWDEDPGVSGHQIPSREPKDERTDAERLIEQGMEEANHERMFRGSQQGAEG